MRVSDAQLAEIWDQGFTVVEGFLDGDALSAAQGALWSIYPRPEDYFADPGQHPRFARSQFAGLRFYPYDSWALNRLAVYPDLVDAAERFLESRDIEIYKVELWAKYAGAINYDQTHHRDYGNHTLVVPRADGDHVQMTTFILLSDVTAQDGPTKVIPQSIGRSIPISPRQQPPGALVDQEVSIEGPAGSLLIYKTDVLHRGSDFTAPGRSRFVMLVDFQTRGWRWNGKMSWPDHAERVGMTEAMVRMSPRERDLFGWPPIGSDYWNAQTLRDVALRYPGIDLTPYAGSA
ncbi:MAG TPA: phytanoyl-CoA dioxygenase family protein [Caulobacteraceae bacterium]|nr:phytanoyl-CoA dioxygenase family protein [Caulobacteraceae bacterium]